MEKRSRARLLRVLLPILGLALALTALGLYRYYGDAPETLEEYYRRLYPHSDYAGPISDRVQYDYNELLEESWAVLVVEAEDELRPNSPSDGGYSVDKSYAGTNPRLKYHFYYPRSTRRVKVLRVLKGEAEPGDSLWVSEPCVLTPDRYMARGDEVWPLVKGNVYLLFLKNRFSFGGILETVNGPNGWFDLTHLGLNDPRYLRVLYAALRDLDMHPGDGPFLTPWTDRRFPLPERA